MTSFYLLLIHCTEDYNHTPRSMNGPEMAQDYLYLSQELWTEPAAFAFASADPDVRAGTLKECHECKKKEAANGEHKRCAACKLVRGLRFGSCSHPILTVSLCRPSIALPSVRKRTGLNIRRVYSDLGSTRGLRR